MTFEENTNELLKNIKNGDKYSFDKLISIYEKTVYRICHRFFNDNEDALDATQEVFLKIYKNIDKFEGRSTFSTWVYRIASNTCLTISERKKKEKESLINSIINWWSNLTQDTPEEKLIDKEEHNNTKKLINDNLTKIPENYRIPLILKDIEGLSLDKISEILEVPVGTVKSRLNRGRAALHEKILYSLKGGNNYE